MLTKHQICKLNDVEPTENVLKAMEEWGNDRYSLGKESARSNTHTFYSVVLIVISVIVISIFYLYSRI